MTVRFRTRERSPDRTWAVRISSDALALGANIAIRAAVVVVVLFSFWTRPVMDSDVQRFSALSVAAGTPYRDYAVEYAPVELGVIRLIGSADARVTGTRLVVMCFLLDLLAFAGMWTGWGRRIAIAYLWLGVPLLVLGYLRLWYLPVALAVWGFALVRKGRPSVAGVVAALAVFAKLWPLALAPAFFAENASSVPRVRPRQRGRRHRLAASGRHRRRPTGAVLPVGHRLGGREHRRRARLGVRRGRTQMGTRGGPCRFFTGPHVGAGCGARGPRRRRLVEGIQVARGGPSRRPVARRALRGAGVFPRLLPPIRGMVDSVGGDRGS